MRESDVELNLARLRLLAELQAFAVFSSDNIDALEDRLLCVVRFNARFLVFWRNETSFRAWWPSLLLC